MGKDKYIKIIHNLLRIAHLKKIYDIINLDNSNY